MDTSSESSEVNRVGGDSSGEENGWQAANEGTGIKAFCGLTLEGKAKVEGKVWRVTLGAGAEFKATDEGGTKQPGVQFLYTPVVVDNTFTWFGSCLGCVLQCWGRGGY